MAVSNTVQGLNSVIDLLKNILDTVKEDNKTVQPRDVSSISRTTAAKSDTNTVNSVSTTADSLNIIKSTNTKNLTQKVNTMTNAIVSLTSKSVTSGLMKFAMLHLLGFTHLFKKGIKTIVDGIILIVENKKLTKNSTEKVKTVTNLIDSIGDTANKIAKTFVYIGASVLIMAAVGVTMVYAWKYVALGFLTLSLISLAIVGLYALLSKLSTAIKGFGDNFYKFVLAINLLSLVVISSLVVGFLAMNFWPQIWRGFLVIAGVSVAVMALYIGLSLASKYIQDLGNNFYKFVLSINLLSLVVISSLVVGFLAQKYGAQILIGFGVIAVIGLAVAGLYFLLSKIGSTGAGTIGMVLAIGAILSIGFVVLSIASLIDRITEVLMKVKKFESETGQNPFDGVGKIAAKIGWFVMVLATELAAATPFMLIASNSIKSINKLMKIVSNFVDMVGKFVADGNSIKPIIGYNSDGTAKFGPAIDIVSVSKSISTAFMIFVKSLAIAFEDIDKKDAKVAKKYGKALSHIMDPLSEFVKIIKNFSDNNPPSNFSEIAETVGTSFSAFVKELATQLDGVKFKGGKRLGNSTNALMGAIGSAFDIFSKYSISADGTKMTMFVDGAEKVIDISNVTTGISTLMKNLLDSFKNFDDGQSAVGTFFNGSNILKYAEFMQAVSDSADGLVKLTTTQTMVNSVWDKINNVVYDKKEPAIAKNSANISKLNNEFKKFTDLIVKNKDRNIKAIKEYTAAVKEMSQQFKETAESMETVANKQLELNTTINNKENNKENTKTQENLQPSKNNNSTSVETNVNTSQQLDMSTISDAIKEGLSGAVVRFTFNDSLEDFVGEMSLS